jgi:hypothetical protein
MIPAAATLAEPRCLNCGANLQGTFCAHCGQRSVPADPTMSELAGDALQELSGYDGRIAATGRALLHPGRLTIDYLQGRRARYLSPMRVYLTVSVIYFLLAASAPPVVSTRTGNVTTGGGLQMTTNDGVRVELNNGVPLTDDDRAELAKSLETAPWFVRGFLMAIAKDPAGLRGRLFTIMPRVFFGLLPVFAGIVALFYRRRRFATSLVFAVHLHAFAFLIFSVSEAAKFSRMPVVIGAVGVSVAIAFTWYVLTALRAVFGGRWPITIAKAAGIGFAYSLAAVPAFLIVLIWASLV